MKNKSVLLGFIIIIIVCLITTGCGLKNSISGDEFKEHFGALGFTINDGEDTENNSLSYLVATKEDYPFNLEYYEFKDEVTAKKAYKNKVDSIGNYITSESQNTEYSNMVFTKTIAVSENEYVIISRIKKTLIFVNTTKEYKTEVDKLLEDIDY